jgi:hypothetical protein
MRRPVMYVGGLLLATGASLALAGPASAATSDCPFGNNNFSVDRDSNFVRYNLNRDVDVRTVDNRDFNNVGLINLGTSQGDHSPASGLLGSLGL